MKNNIYILTAVHNDLQDTKKLLSSIFSQKYKNYELFIIDDGSTDGTYESIAKNYPKVKIFKGNGNLWWTASLNLGLSKILKIAKKGDFVWIINNDCYFSDGTIGGLVREGIKEKNSIIGSTVLDSRTKKIWDNGVSIDWSKLEFKKGGNDALSTKGTLYPIEVFKKIGFFDDKHFPHYFSDYEFSIRAKANGYKLKVSRESVIYNRTKRTGFEFISFSKKSKLNPFLILKILWFACPVEYRIQAFLVLISKLIYGKH